MWSIKGGEKADNTDCFRGAADVGHGRQELQSSYYKYVQRTKGTMFKEQKEIVITVSQKIENIN